MRAKLRGVEIYFDVDGEGLTPLGDKLVEKPVLIALHGGPGGDHSQFRPALKPLTEIVQIVYLDHRGNGRSARPPLEQCTMEEMADDVEALRQHLGLGKVALLGSSFGGMVALTYAVRHPDSLSHLIASVTAASREFRDEAIANARARFSPEIAAAVESLLTGNIRDEDHHRELATTVRQIYYYQYDPAYDATGTWTIPNLALQKWFFTDMLRTYDLRPHLGEIKVPTLVLTGRHDWACSPTQSEVIRRGIPDARQVIFEHSSHQAMREENTAYLRAVREFLTGVPVPAPVA